MATRKVVFVSRLKPGSEQQIANDLPNEFPHEALSQIEGIKRVTICQGSGLFAAIVEYEGDFEKIFHDYISSPSTQAFHAKFGRFFDAPLSSDQPADLPLVGDVFEWDRKALRRAAG